MPELEYVVLADYVRQDAGMTHIMGAGIDTFYIPPEHLPLAVPVGLAARITFSSRDQVGEEHEINLVFQGPGGQELLTANQSSQTPPPPAGIPGHWPTAANVISRFALPIPSHGDYQLRVAIDDDPRLSRTINVRAIAPQAEQN
jgi:hypothetical protein